MGFFNLPKNNVMYGLAYILVIYGSLNIRDWVNAKYAVPIWLSLAVFVLGFEILTPTFFKNGG